MNDQSIQGGAIAHADPIGNRNLKEIIGGGADLPISLQVMFNPQALEAVKEAARLMAAAQGFTPAHLLGKQAACFAVINIALDAKLKPYFVARHTYETPSGAIGFDGALTQAMLGESGRFVGAPEFEYRGDWAKVTGKFRMQTSRNGKDFQVRAWTDQDAVGCGVIVRWQVKGERKPRCWPGEDTPFQLTQCYPLNSPLWATDPRTQIAYLVIRRFANQVAPEILGAAAFDEEQLLDASDRARDITPGTGLDMAVGESSQGSQESWAVIDLDGVENVFTKPERALAAIEMLVEEAARDGIDRLDGLWEDNAGTIADLSEVPGFRDMMNRYKEIHEEASRRVAAEEGPGSDASAQTPRSDPGSTEGAAQVVAPQGHTATAAPSTNSVDGARTLAPQGQALGAPSEEEGSPTDRAPEGQNDRGDPSINPADGARDAAPQGRTSTAPPAGEGSPGENAPQGQRVRGGPSTNNQEANRPPTPAGAKPATNQDATAASSAPTAAAQASSPTGRGQTAASSASRSEAPGGEERTSKAVSMTQNGKLLDHKTWLEVMVTSKMRQQKTTPDLAWFLGDNAEAIEEALRHLNGADRKNWEEVKRTHWARIEQMENGSLHGT